MLIIVSCNSKQKSDSNRIQRTDSELLNDSTNTTISRIDGTSIEVQELDARIKSLMDSANVTGMAISILNNNQIVYKKAYGYANLDKKMSLQVNSSFYGASLSKAVFGYLVAKLANKGIIDLDRPLQQYLEVPIPELPTDKEWRGFHDLQQDRRYEFITARMCLSHTTGFQNWRWIPRPDDADNREKLKIYFDPGTEYYYSGEGFMLLQHVIEQITGKDAEQLAEEQIFTPLQMRNTSYIWQDRFENRYCNGHTVEQEVIKKDKSDETAVAGSLETNLIDYSILVRHILRLHQNQSKITSIMFNPNFRIRTKAQFGPSSLEQSDDNDDIKLSYGLGWGLLYSPYGFGAFKEGHGEGFQHYAIIFPDQGIGIVILSNSDNAEGIFKELLEITIADIYTPWAWEHYIPYQLRTG